MDAYGWQWMEYGGIDGVWKMKQKSCEIKESNDYIFEWENEWMNR